MGNFDWPEVVDVVILFLPPTFLDTVPLLSGNEIDTSLLLQWTLYIRISSFTCQRLSHVLSPYGLLRIRRSYLHGAAGGTQQRCWLTAPGSPTVPPRRLCLAIFQKTCSAFLSLQQLRNISFSFFHLLTRNSLCVKHQMRLEHGLDHLDSYQDVPTKQ